VLSITHIRLEFQKSTHTIYLRVPHLAEITVCSGPDLFSLANQGVIVTGAARGLGLCIATSLLEAQCPHVYCLDILESPSASEWITATQTAKKTGGRITYRKLDITDEHAVAKVIGEIFENCDCDIKGFFGAAGIQQMIPALEYPVEQFRKMMDVNVTGECANS
jgi:NAD(P)-dependent dehydrogenase (short-subunit alcohol dehydrogenase family)